MKDTLRKISASQLNTFGTCKRLYYYNYIDIQPSYTNPLTIMGSSLHRAIEQKLKGKGKPLITFVRDFEERIDADNVKRLDKAQLAKKTGIEIIGKIEWSKLIPFNEDFIEYSFELPFPRDNPIVVIRGIIDLLTHDMIVIDHKSAQRTPTLKERSWNPQFIIYLWAVHELLGEYPKTVLYHSLREGKFYETNVEQDITAKLEWLEEQIRILIAEEEYPKKEKPDGFCSNVCDFYVNCFGERK